MAAWSCMLSGGYSALHDVTRAAIDSKFASGPIVAANNGMAIAANHQSLGTGQVLVCVSSAMNSAMSPPVRVNGAFLTAAHRRLQVSAEASKTSASLAQWSQTLPACGLHSRCRNWSQDGDQSCLVGTWLDPLSVISDLSHLPVPTVEGARMAVMAGKREIKGWQCCVDGLGLALC
jgi:hypothetical protein